MKDVHEFGREVDKLRGRAGLSQHGLAALAGVQQCNISAIIRGDCIPREKTLRKLAEVLPLDLEVWMEPVRQYHRECKLRANQVRAETIQRRKAERERGEGTPPRPVSVKKKQSAGLGIGEICRRAREAGMTYGEYIAKHPYL